MHACIYFYPAVTVTATAIITVWPVSHYCDVQVAVAVWGTKACDNT